MDELVSWLADIIWEEVLVNYVGNESRTAITTHLELVLEEALPDILAQIPNSEENFRR